MKSGMIRAGVTCLLAFVALAMVPPAGQVFALDPFEDFGGSEVDRFTAEMEDEIGEFLQEQAQEVKAFQDERDREFLEFMREAWQEYQEFAGVAPPTRPKPPTMPKATPTPPDSKVVPRGPRVVPPPLPAPALPKAQPVKPHVGPLPEVPPVAPDTKPAVKVPDAPPAAPQVNPVGGVPEAAPASPQVKPVPEVPQAPPAPAHPVGWKMVAVPMLGQKVKIACDPKSRFRLESELSTRVVADFWEHQSRSDYKPLLDQLQQLRGELHLNDWGYYRLVRSLSQEVQQREPEASLYSWFLLTKSGYRTKVGFEKDRVYLLAPAENTIYTVPFFKFDKVRYYNLSYFDNPDRPGRIYSFEAPYPGAERRLDLNILESPLAPSKEETRELAFSYDGKKHSIPVVYNANVVRFFEDYPQTEFPIFFRALVAPETERSLLTGLAPLVEGKRETEAVNLLLRFVQTAFEYKTDDDQFGREKYLFVEETLRFPYSDCEDRSILFSYLVRKLTGLETVALKYPNHLATAVRFSGKVDGDVVEVDGARYVVCDPTYINANIGMAMPQFRKVKPEVIRIAL